MEAIIYDKLFRKVRILDTFTSFIWNDSYIGAGDFEIEYPVTENGLSYVEEGYYLQNEQSEHIMIIEKINIITDYENGNRCLLSGRSLESIILRRPLRYSIAMNDGNFQSFISMVLSQNFINPSNQKRKIEGFAFMPSNDPEIANMTITAEFNAGENCYDLISKVCSERHVGFRIVLHSERFFQFELYKGKDRSYSQTDNAWVIFSSDFENLEESDMTIDTQNLRNCMEIDLTIVQHTKDDEGNDITIETLYPLSIGDNVTGLDRRELYASSRQELEEIDKSIFGTAEQRVNEIKYSSWEAVSFDSAGYNKAMEKYDAQILVQLQNASTPKKTTITYALQPGDPGYTDVSQTPGAEWINTRTKVVEEDPEVVRNRLSAFISSIEGTAPSKEEFTTYAWVITDRAGYNAAIAQAQADIDAEYNNAVMAAINFIKAKVLQNAAQELSQYSKITSFDGKVDPNLNFIYGRDYYLGDEVQVVNAYRFNSKTRVTGITFCQDNQNGIIARPTFESDDIAKIEFNLSDFSD